MSPNFRDPASGDVEVSVQALRCVMLTLQKVFVFLRGDYFLRKQSLYGIRYRSLLQILVPGVPARARLQRALHVYAHVWSSHPYAGRVRLSSLSRTFAKPLSKSDVQCCS